MTSFVGCTGVTFSVDKIPVWDDSFERISDNDYASATKLFDMLLTPGFVIGGEYWFEYRPKKYKTPNTKTH